MCTSSTIVKLVGYCCFHYVAIIEVGLIIKTFCFVEQKKSRKREEKGNYR